MSIVHSFGFLAAAVLVVAAFATTVRVVWRRGQAAS